MPKRSLILAWVALTSMACTSKSSGSGGSGGTTTLPAGGVGGTVTDLADSAVGAGGNGTGGTPTTGSGGAAGMLAEAGVALATGGSTALTTADKGSGGSLGTGGISTAGTGGAAGSGTGGISTAGTGGAAGSGTPITPDAGLASDGGAAGTVGCDQDLSGTWDLFATAVGSGIVKGVLSLSKDGFSLDSNGAVLTYKAKAATASWAYESEAYGKSTRVISVQSTPAPANSGSVPFALGGHWVLQSNTETCVLDIATDKVSGKCTGPLDDPDVAAIDWPSNVLPSPQNRVSYTGTRTSALASQFGDFGGNWTGQSDTGSGQGCALKLEGNGASTTCHASNMFNGALHLTVGADCVASGVTPSGMEVSARRR
jgi:hypothetical protein